MGIRALAHGADLRPRLLAFASENWLTIAIGEYKPGKGWVRGSDSYSPPQPGDVLTVFGNTGKLGEIVVKAERRPDPAWTPGEWHARVERGTTILQPFVLAIQGSWPDAGVAATELPTNDPASVQIVSNFLKDRGLKVETPLVTQAYETDLVGNGQTEILICAHSDTSALADNKEAAIYALALLHIGGAGKEKTIPLAIQASHKPVSRSVEEHEHLYGTRDFYRFIAIHDIEGDGRKEIVLYRAKEDATQIDVFTFDGHHKRKVLSAYKANYN